MKYILLLSLLSTALFAKVHYAKVEPLERTTIKASVSGIITNVNLSSEGKFADNSTIVQIDDAIDRVSLKTSQESLSLVEQTLSINEQVLRGIKETHQIKKSYYERVKSIATSTVTQKDNANSAYIASSNQVLATQEKIINLKKQILDLNYKIAMLKDTIGKKSISSKGRYIYKIMVRAGEFASPGMPLAIVDDLSKAKLVIYLNKDELKDIKNKKVYIDGAESSEQISNIWKETDDKFISEYKAEIIIDPKYQFSSLLKIELR